MAGQPHKYTASILAFGDRANLRDGSLRYLAATGGINMGPELGLLIPQEGELKNLYWSCESSGLTGSGHLLTVYVNGAATPLETAWDGNVTSGTNTTDVVPVAAGDRVSVRIRLAAGGTRMQRARVTIELEADSASPWLRDEPNVYFDDGNVGIGTDSPGERLSVDGIVESMAGGFKFPDGSLQASAAAGGGGGVFALQGGVVGDPPHALYAHEGGNLGIGTGLNPPQQRLTLAPGSSVAVEMPSPAGVAVAAAPGGDLSNGTYYFRIVATDGVGTTKGSAEVSCAIVNPPNGTCRLSWDPVEGAASYRIYEGTAPGAQEEYQESATNSHDYTTERVSVPAPEGVPELTTAYHARLAPTGPSWALGGSLGVGHAIAGERSGLRIESGTLRITEHRDYPVIFVEPFAEPPVVVLGSVYTQTYEAYATMTAEPSPERFSVRLIRGDTRDWAIGAVGWLAIGPSR